MFCVLMCLRESAAALAENCFLFAPLFALDFWNFTFFFFLISVLIAYSFFCILTTLSCDAARHVIKVQL